MSKNRPILLSLPLPSLRTLHVYTIRSIVINQRQRFKMLKSRWWPDETGADDLPVDYEHRAYEAP